MRRSSTVAILSLATLASVVPGCEHARSVGGGQHVGGSWASVEPKPLFNGKDLDGWVRVNCYEDTFQARDGMIYCTGTPTGFLRTAQMYEDFVLEFDWKHENPAGNAGLFVWSDPVPSRDQHMFPRSIEVQVMHTPDVSDKEGRLLYTGHGDVFSIWGARMTPLRPHPAGWERTLPSERVTKGAGEWNHYKVIGEGGNLTVEVNGVEVSGARACTPRDGYICLESEGSPVWFRNLTIRSRRSDAGVPAAERAMDGTGMVPLFGGRTLAGWREEDGKSGHWSFRDGVLRYDGKGGSLWTVEEYDDFELVVDWRWTKEHQGRMLRPHLDADGNEVRNADGSPHAVEVEERDSGIYLRGSRKAQVNIWMWPCGSGEVWGYRTDTAMPLDVRRGCVPKVNADRPVGEWNRFIIRMVGDRLTVFNNGQKVIDQVHLPGVPARGPIALQDHGCPIEFQNVFIRRR